MTLEEVTTLKEAIKRLKEVIKEVRSTIQPFLYDNEAKDYILKALEQEPKWIPVSERLPEKNVWVLVTVVQGSGWYVETMRIDKYKGMFTDNIDYYDSVIAWMPLPKPYKAESEG